MREPDETATSSKERENGVTLDPICGTPVVEEDAPSMEYRGREYFFCSERCRERFSARADRIRVAELAKMGGLFAAKKARWGVA